LNTNKSQGLTPHVDCGGSWWKRKRGRRRRRRRRRPGGRLNKSFYSKQKQ
jgi:hypothetical protein